MPNEAVRAAIWICAPLIGLAIFVGVAALLERKREKASNALYLCGFTALAGAIAFLWELSVSGSGGSALVAGAIWMLLAFPIVFLTWLRPRLLDWVERRRTRSDERGASTEDASSNA
jgi:hypothetical protein